MYNLSINGADGSAAGGSGLLTLPQGENSTTPRTPEIVNSLIAMSNPFESSYRAHGPRLASSPPGGSDTSTSSSGSMGCVSPPSVQHTCSQLIKEGLKLTIQSKRRHGLAAQDPKLPRRDEVGADFDDDSGPLSPGDGLTPEDEERRRRRRERNKIAATKCRLKKRERTVNLVQESEILENQNHDLKSQIQELETQRRRLVDMLSVHRSTCTKTQHTFSTGDPFPRDSGSVFRRINTSFPRPSVSSSVLDNTMSYRRVETCVEPYRRMETVLEETYCRPPIESIAYNNFDSQELKDTTVLVPFCRSSASGVETPSFSRISDQYSCQNFTDLDQFVKPELPSIAAFHSSELPFGRTTSLDMNCVASEFDNANSPGLMTATYRQFDDESETFSGEFSPAGLDRSCIV